VTEGLRSILGTAVPTGAALVGAPSLPEHFRRLWARRETVRFLTSSNLKAGHRDKVLGHLWNLLDPLMFMLVYYFVFGVLLRLAGGGKSVDFMLYILIGVLTFRFISSTINQAANCVRSNRGLIHEINFPKSIFPVSATLAHLYDFVWGVVVIEILLLLAGYWPTVQFLWLPLLIVILAVFTMGAAFLVAYLGAFYADMTNVIGVVLRLLFYLSPIFYYVRPKPGVDPEHVFLHGHTTVHALYMLNPIACFYETMRDALLWGDMPEPRMMLYAAAISLGMGLFGFAVFTRGEGKFAKYI
jgi:ABC-type polysaccharide/polyol phosphate export permease